MLDVMSSSREVNIFMGHEPNPKIFGFLASVEGHFLRIQVEGKKA